MTEAITSWGRPLRYADEPYHGIVALDPQRSVETACRGRWAASEPGHYITGRDRTTNDEGRPFNRCAACDGIAGQQRLREGLRELAAAEVLEMRLGYGVADPDFCRGLNQFDISDLKGEG